MSSARAFLLSGAGGPYLLVPAIPLAIALDLAGAPSTVVFIASALGVIPTAALMGRATEELAERSGPGIGALLNVTFGNAPELIIALVALAAGLDEVVKASLIGSILGNVLLVLGAAMLAGGVGRERQLFDRTAASQQSSMLLLAATAFALPVVLVLARGGGLPAPGARSYQGSSDIEALSLAISILLVIVYALGLLFSLRTHRALFNPVDESGPDEDGHEPWSVRRSVGLLAVAGIAVAGMSEILVHSIEGAARAAGLTEFFIGVIVVAIVGNAAEHWVAVAVAMKDKMDLAVNIAIGSSSQIALFVVPVLVICSFFLGPHPMPLVFNALEVAGVTLAVLIANVVTQEGESTWFEGVLLLATYAVLALAFAWA